MSTMGDGTRAVRAYLPEPEQYEPTLPGPVFAAHFHLSGEPVGPYTYGRDTNPTWTHLERAIGELEAPGEDVSTTVFASGMAAITAVLLSQVRTGDTVVLPDDGYQALPLVREQLTAFGVEVRTAPTGGDAQLALLEGARLLWIESPSTRASTSATSAASWPPRTRRARWSPSTTPWLPRSASARWSSARTSRSPVTPRA